MAKKNLTPLAAAVGAAFLASASLSSVVSASENPFASSDLQSGYNLAEKGAEGKCGEGKCGEGKCGGKKKADKEGKCGEGKCGEGKCGGEKKAEKEGKCGEGKCGEGKCGGKS
ncbi:MAG: HvfA family oxazolone/thioamide-modified RiPP metallophore [Cellvibrionaceae bacterium]